MELIVLGRCFMRQRQSVRMSYWKLLNYRRVVRTLVNNYRGRSEQLKYFASKQVYPKEGH
jgi:hypothetical protein